MSKPSAVEGEQVDHRRLAENDRSFASTLSERDAAVDRLLASAQVHASLAIAEQLERLNETLEGISEPPMGTFDGALRVRNA